MKTKKVKKIMSLFLAALMCVTTFAGFGTTAYAAEETDEVYLVSFPRDGDANYGGEWGHGSHEFMNGWATDTSRYTSVYAMRRSITKAIIPMCISWHTRQAGNHI